MNSGSIDYYKTQSNEKWNTTTTKFEFRIISSQFVSAESCQPAYINYEIEDRARLWNAENIRFRKLPTNTLPDTIE